jgi:eukaryotic-like serine/threonine-protein kinase
VLCGILPPNSPRVSGPGLALFPGIMLALQAETEFVDEFLLPGTVVGDRYRICELLAWGGMGLVYRAVHLELNSDVAVKTMRRELVNDNDAYERFVREARTAAKLKSNHVAKVFDFGRMKNGRPYLVMELLNGESLSKRLTRGSLSNQETIQFLVQACAGLADAHSQGIVHRDLKPDNLFLAEVPNGGVELKVLDFGIAKSLVPSGKRQLTMAGGGVGSPSYMAPEQMRSRPDLDQRADVWALGAVAYELLSGAPAFDGESITEICAKVLTEDPRPLRALRGDVWPELEAIIATCLERDREQRFADVQQLSDALTHALESHDPSRKKPVLELVAAPTPVSVRVTREDAIDCDAATEANLDVSVELSQIAGLRPRRWPKRLAWVAAAGVAAAAAWVWWVGFDQASAYAQHRYETELVPSASANEEPSADETVTRSASRLPVGALIEARPATPRTAMPGAMPIVMKNNRDKLAKSSEPQPTMVSELTDGGIPASNDPYPDDPAQ